MIGTKTLINIKGVVCLYFAHMAFKWFYTTKLGAKRIDWESYVFDLP